MDKITLKDLTEYFKTLNNKNNLNFKHFYRGYLDTKNEYSLGFYNLENNFYDDCIDENNINDYTFTLLIHWNDSYDDTENAGNKLFNTIKSLKNKDVFINKNKVSFLLESGNQDVGIDTKTKTYERVIKIRILY